MKWCDIKIALKSHSTDNISNSAYPKIKKEKPKTKSCQTSFQYQVERQSALI
jgi:hypothetical protein